jgi:hypothetical protein
LGGNWGRPNLLVALVTLEEVWTDFGSSSSSGVRERYTFSQPGLDALVEEEVVVVGEVGCPPVVASS